MTLAATGTTEAFPTPSRSAHQVRLGIGSGLFGAAGWLTWLTWRVATVSSDPVPVLMLAVELIGAISGLVMAAALVRPPAGSGAAVEGVDRGSVFAVALGNHLGHPVGDVSPRRLRGGGLVGVATTALHLDGPRRAALVALSTIGLLIGSSPMPLPPATALGALALALAGVAWSHVLLSGGAIAIGDRTRWGFCSQIRGHRWTATVAAAVVLSLAIALRGMSDRWTHGLDPMHVESRAVALLFAVSLTVGALYTLATTDPPEPQQAGELIPRRHEERTARQPALAGAVLVGVIGLVAGLLPGSVDTTHHDPARVEQVSERELRLATDE
jgi:hypothetical protein